MFFPFFSFESLNDQFLSEFRWHTEEIKKAVKNINWDLQDLEEAVEIAAKDPERFKLTREEVDDRQKFIKSFKRQVESISSELASEATLSKIHSDAQNALFAVSDSSSAKGTNNPNHDFSAVHQQQMMAVRDRQGERLHLVSPIIISHLSFFFQTMQMGNWRIYTSIWFACIT